MIFLNLNLLLLHIIRRLWFQMIHNHNQNIRFHSITDCLHCIVMEEIKFSLIYW